MIAVALLFSIVVLVGANHTMHNATCAKDCMPVQEHGKVDSLLHSPLTELFHQFAHSTPFHVIPNVMSSMPIDIAEGPESYLVHVDLPGVDKENVKVTVSPSQHEMQISAFKESSKETSGHHYRRIERQSGHMTRTVFLPEKAKMEDLSAEFKQGVLEIRLPKQTATPEHLQRRLIEIK